MADYEAFHSDPRRQNSRLIGAEPVSSFGSSVIAGLALFGLAANGCCLAGSTQSGANASSEEPLNSDPVRDNSDAALFAITLSDSRIDSKRRSRCQR
jgi:hypothetical protein